MPANANALPFDESAQPARVTHAELFRANAVRSREAPTTNEALPSLGSGRWLLLAFMSSLLAFAIVGGFAGRIEVTSVALGALVVRGGPRPALAQAPGRVALLGVRAGEQVVAGQEIARVDATELQAREQRSQEQMRVVHVNADRVTKSRSLLRTSAVRALQRKRALLAQRAVLKQAVCAQRKQRTQNTELLAREGAASHVDAEAAREAQRSAEEELLLIRQQIAEVDLELSDRTKEFESEQESLSRQLDEVAAEAAEAHSVTALSSVTAPVSGKLESLLVTSGQVVSTGDTLARIIPDGASNSLVVFAPVKDAAFLRPGLQAWVEFASLPVSEFGKARARVTRVSSDVATNQEVSDVLGTPSEQTVVRVELELLSGPALSQVGARLRSGERVTARLNTRKRRIITLLFDFLRRWYPT